MDMIKGIAESITYKCKPEDFTLMKDQKNRMVNSGDFRQDPNYVAPDKEKEKLILQLGTMITDRYLVKYSRTMKTDDPEYWALDDVLTKEEAKFLLSFKKTRVPYDIEDLAKMNNMSYEDTKKMVDHLVWVGLIEMNRENADHHKQYNVPIFVPGSAEFMMMNDELTAQHPKLATFFNLMTQMPLENVTPMIPPGGAGVGMHVIPVEKAIESENMSASVEHISHWLSKYDKYSVGQCTCRKQQTMRGEGSGQINGEFCMGMGDMAEYCVDRGMGRYISYEEALEILERAERHGRPAYAMRSEPASSITRPICPEAPTARTWTNLNVSPAASAWRYVLSARQSLARNFVRNREKSSIPSLFCPMRRHGARITGIFIIAKTPRSTAMIQARRPARRHVPRTWQYRAM